MKRFQFRLEAFLRYREYQEQSAQMEVARARSDLMACEEKIARSREDCAKKMRELETRTSAGIESDRFLLFSEYLAGVESFLESEDGRRGELVKILEAKQKDLAEKSVKRKSLENLREQRKEEYYKEIANALGKETDDGVVLRKARDVNR